MCTRELGPRKSGGFLFPHDVFAQQLALSAPDLEVRGGLRSDRSHGASERAEGLEEFRQIAPTHFTRIVEEPANRNPAPRALDEIVDGSILIVDVSSMLMPKAAEAAVPAAEAGAEEGARGDRNVSRRSAGYNFSDLGPRRRGVQRGHLDAAHRPGLAGVDPAHPQQRDGGGYRQGPSVRAAGAAPAAHRLRRGSPRPAGSCCSRPRPPWASSRSGSACSR